MTTTAPERPKPRKFCLNCLETVTETPAEHLATCTRSPFKFQDGDGNPELMEITEVGDDPSF
jgi:hypothetical protein